MGLQLHVREAELRVFLDALEHERNALPIDDANTP